MAGGPGCLCRQQSVAADALLVPAMASMQASKQATATTMATRRKKQKPKLPEHNGCFDAAVWAVWPKRPWRCGYVRLACRFPREDRVQLWKRLRQPPPFLALLASCPPGPSARLWNPPNCTPCCFSPSHKYTSPCRGHDLPAAHHSSPWIREVSEVWGVPFGAWRDKYTESAHARTLALSQHAPTAWVDPIFPAAPARRSTISS